MFKSLVLIFGVAMILGGCATAVPQGTLAMEVVKKQFTLDDIKSGKGYSGLLKTGIKPEDIGDHSMVRMSPYRDMFGGGNYTDAYVPVQLRDRVEIGDIVEVSGSGLDAAGKLRYNTITRIVRKNNDDGPNPCGWVGLYLTSQHIECDYYEKDGWSRLPSGMWVKLPDGKR